MDFDRIKELLQQADESAGEPKLAANLVERTYQAYAHRRRTSLALFTAAGIVMVAGLLYVTGFVPNYFRSTPPQEVVQRRDDPSLRTNPVQLAQVQIDRLRAEIAQLRSEAEGRQRIIEQILISQKEQARVAELERQLAVYTDPLVDLTRQRERAALILLYQADRKYNKLNLKDSALSDYQQVIETFPNTRWAQTARQRLAKIEDLKEGATL